MKKIRILLLLLITGCAGAKEVFYDLTIAAQHVNITGKPVHAMTINGGIPGPTLRFKEGDAAVINVHNNMKHETSIHWHGMLVPPDMDGVPFVSFPPIKPGATFTYRFPIRQNGTYWYHSHTHLQEQIGVYGSIVIDPKSGRESSKEHVVVLSDWTNRNPPEVLRTLRRGSEFFSIEKKTAQSVLGAAKTGTLSDFFQREAMRMPAMDLSDVAYDAFITNGKPEESIAARPGQTVRLRIINAAAGSYFHMNWAGGPLTIVAADGQRVEPVRMDEPLLIAIAETYDVLVKVPADGSYEFRSTAQDGSGKTSLWIGTGEKHFAKDIPKPFVYESMMGFDLKHLLALTPQGTMGMNDRMVESGAFDKPGMNMGSMGHGSDMGGMNHGGMNMNRMDHGSTEMGGMKHKKMAMEGMSEEVHTAMQGMDHSKMDMPDMKKEQEGDVGKMDHTQMRHGSDMGMGTMDHSNMKDGAGMAMGAMSQDSMQGMDMGGGMGGMKGMKHNPPKLYDFLLREDAARAPMLMSDGMPPDRPFSPYKKLRALKDTSLPDNAPRRTFRLTLDGEMGRYVWMINNRPLSPDDDLHIKEGEVVQFIMINRTMMHHPMHLHGHFFRVINGQGDRSPLKHTVNVEPMSTTVIEFMANEPGDWFFHCHILYHMMSGMARVVRYEGFTPAPETEAIGNGVYEEHNPFLFYGYADVMSNMNQGQITASSLLNIFNLEWQAGWDGVSDTEWETTFTYERFINRFTNVFVGVHAEGVDWTREDERLVGGVRYLLPGNFLSTAWVDSDGEARITLDRELMLTPRLSIFGEVEYDTRDDWSYQVGLSYLLTKSLSATALWDSDYGVGAGFTVRF
ncbi:multicopper oxidase domain-containing protein [Haloferula sp. BvORR071]|uniref:multicopper oxidase domain-containing protein n=1 Tax=Haloferula sp. BvORR071 TaxID=1396141 RepID=UPI00054F6701|nr:multicopper oxidase domain-containing protein [Haloferula sp. BvORR071]